MAWVVVPETSKLILDKANIPYPCLLYLFGRPAPPPSYDMGCSITTNQCLCCRGRVETEKDQPNQNMTIKLFWFPWLSHAKWILLQHPLESRQDVATIWHMSYFLWQISRDLHWKICIADCMRYVQDFFKFAQHHPKTQGTLWQHPTAKICANCCPTLWFLHVDVWALMFFWCVLKIMYKTWGYFYSIPWKKC